MPGETVIAIRIFQHINNLAEPMDNGHLQTATVLIITATTAIPHPNTKAAMFKC